MINKFICCGLVFCSLLTATNQTQPSTTAIVTIVGSVIQNNDSIVEKYKREDCPVCNGKGWYISGDGIQKIDCQYCEP